jgi:hypothetical protein
VVVGWGLLKVAPEPAKTIEFTSKKSGFVPRFVPRFRAHFRVLFMSKQKSLFGLEHGSSDRAVLSLCHDRKVSGTKKVEQHDYPSDPSSGNTPSSLLESMPNRYPMAR